MIVPGHRDFHLGLEREVVKIGGGLEDQIDVEIDQQKLQQLNLNVSDVTKRLSDENVNVSGGRIDNGSQRYLVRTVNQFGNLDENDPRSVARMMKRMGDEMGEDLGDDLDAAMDEAMSEGDDFGGDGEGSMADPAGVDEG